MASSGHAHIPAEGALTQLLAGAHRLGNLPYAGDISPEDAYEFIKSEQALVVDVRTVPEWQFTGIADLSDTQGKLATISWKLYPDFSANKEFAGQLAATGVSKDVPLLFICRSGGRSLDAAVAMSALGYSYCFNISGGFEGDADVNGHRGTTHGWKARKLPWKQG